MKRKEKEYSGQAKPFGNFTQTRLAIVDVNQLGLIVHGAEYISLVNFKDMWCDGLKPSIETGKHSGWSRKSEISLSLIGSLGYKGSSAFRYGGILPGVGYRKEDVNYKNPVINFACIISPEYVKENRDHFTAVGSRIKESPEEYSIGNKLPYSLKVDEIEGAFPDEVRYKEGGIPIRSGVTAFVVYTEQEFNLLKKWMFDLTGDSPEERIPIYAVNGDLLWSPSHPNGLEYEEIKKQKTISEKDIYP